MNYGSETEIRIGVAEMIKPPTLVSVSDAAQQFMHIVNPSGSMGTWSAELTPYLIEPMDLLRSRLYEAIVFCGPARSGKTLAMIEGSIAYSIACDPADTLIVQSNQSQAEDYSKTRIARMIAGSPELAKRLSPRAHDDNVLLKFFRSGMALRFGWPSLAQLSGKDIRRVLMTDVDNFTGDLKVDEAFGLALKRTQTYMSAGMLVAESSPAKDHDKPGWRPATPHEAPPADGILALYNRGDRRRWYWPCPHCREYFEAAPGLSLFRLPDLEQLVEMVRETAVEALVDRWSEIFCPHCAAGIGFGHRKAMNAAGRWVGEGQKAHADGTVTGERLRSRVASFWMGGVAAAYQKWDSLIERYLQAVKHYANTGEQQALKSTVNVDQAMPFVPVAVGAKRDTDEMRSRAEFWERDTVPAGVRYLTAAVDVQKASFVVQVHGHGEHGEKWIVARYSLRTSKRDAGGGEFAPLDPAGYLEDWRRIEEEVVTRRYPLAGYPDRTMPIQLTLVDSGGKAGVTQRAYEWWRSLRLKGLAHRVRLVKGANRDDVPRVRQITPDARGKTKSGAVGDVPVLYVNTTLLKDAVAADMIRPHGPGCFHFPAWLPASFYDELTAEVRGAKGWDNPGGARNEAFDLAVYNAAAVIHLKGDRINWQSPQSVPPWAMTWDLNPEIAAVEARPATDGVFIKNGVPRKRGAYLGSRR